MLKICVRLMCTYRNKVTHLVIAAEFFYYRRWNQVYISRMTWELYAYIFSNEIHLQQGTDAIPSSKQNLKLANFFIFNNQLSRLSAALCIGSRDIDSNTIENTFLPLIFHSADKQHSLENENENENEMCFAWHIYKCLCAYNIKISIWNELVKKKQFGWYHLQEIAIKKMEQKCAANLSVQQKKRSNEWRILLYFFIYIFQISFFSLRLLQSTHRDMVKCTGKIL